MSPDEVLTAAEVAADLRCSKAEVYKLIAGKVRGTTRLPAIFLGRRRLVRRAALEQWKRANENAGTDGIMPVSPELDAVERTKGAFRA